MLNLAEAVYRSRKLNTTPTSWSGRHHDRYFSEPLAFAYGP
jgi:hypothetical protein